MTIRRLLLLLNTVVLLAFPNQGDAGAIHPDTLIVVQEETFLPVYLSNPTLALVKRADTGTGLIETSFQDLRSIQIRISDDSPDENESGGALFFPPDILIYDSAGNVTKASESGLAPIVEGGLVGEGFLWSDGREIVELRFDFLDAQYTGPNPNEIERLILELVVANDYLLEVFINEVMEGSVGAHGNIYDYVNISRRPHRDRRQDRGKRNSGQGDIVGQGKSHGLLIDRGPMRDIHIGYHAQADV